MLEGLIPFDDLVIVKRDEPESRIGAIIIPPAAQADVDQGIIVAMGPGRRTKVRLPMSCREGDRVLFSKHANLEFLHRGEKYVTMREDDLIGIIDTEP